MVVIVSIAMLSTKISEFAITVACLRILYNRHDKHRLFAYLVELHLSGRWLSRKLIIQIDLAFRVNISGIL